MFFNQNRADNPPLQAAAKAALLLAGSTAWEKINVQDIANTADLKLADIYDLGGKPVLLAEIDSMFDRVMGEGLSPLLPDASEDDRRERLLHVIMQRFDAMENHRSAIENIQDFYAKTPTELAKAGMRRTKTAKWALFVAGVDEKAIGTKALGLTAILLRGMRVWLADEDAHDKTAEAIEKDLSKVRGWKQDIVSFSENFHDRFSSFTKNAWKRGRHSKDEEV
ncbi:hypothetical protein [Hirschia baltica]|uniref:TetR family transcriptional regulator n=1 Tax=Hirschia baltica (strain ATCC 49814 / DSM 5838 / IFAM 1418) TaxID=582402 RepID=C6XLV8_HIRBI|nr:hypothetical protein [Hirschia baltica]ACT58014.1 hypothetical protein Hbal_0312 [Hirschia baltica ATCC 49814]